MKRILKILGVAAGAGAIKGVIDVALPQILPPALSGPIAVVVATALAYMLPPPKN